MTKDDDASKEWRDHLDGELNKLANRLEEKSRLLYGKYEEILENYWKMQMELQSIRTKITIISSIAAAAVSGAVAIIVKLVHL